jgi:tetratricopeptide (TPR) repeat protein
MQRVVSPLFFTWVLLLFAPHTLNLAAQQADDATVQSYSRAAEEALSRKDPDAAIAALEKLTHLTPNDPQVYANLGAVYYTQGRYPQAAKAYQTALRLDPNLPQVPLMLGMCDMELGQPKEAIPLLEAAFQNPPNDEVGRSIGLNLSSAYLSLNQQTKALEITGALLDRYPNDPEVLYRASHLYGDMALKTMTHLVDVAPDSIWKRMSFAEALEAEKKYDLAIIEYRKVIADEPDMPAVHYRLGKALLLRAPDSVEARDEALKELQQAVELDPRNSAAEYEMGEIYRREGQLRPARDHFSRAVTLDPTVEDAQIALARTLLRMQEPKDSVPHLVAAIQLNPTNEVSHFLLASAYKSLGNPADYENEMALYRRYHSKASQGQSGNGEQPPQALATPASTKQTLDPETKSRPN